MLELHPTRVQRTSPSCAPLLFTLIHPQCTGFGSSCQNCIDSGLVCNGCSARCMRPPLQRWAVTWTSPVRRLTMTVRVEVPMFAVCLYNPLCITYTLFAVAPISSGRCCRRNRRVKRSKLPCVAGTAVRLVLVGNGQCQTTADMVVSRIHRHIGFILVMLSSRGTSPLWRHLSFALYGVVAVTRWLCAQPQGYISVARQELVAGARTHLFNVFAHGPSCCCAFPRSSSPCTHPPHAWTHATHQSSSPDFQCSYGETVTSLPQATLTPPPALCLLLPSLPPVLVLAAVCLRAITLAYVELCEV